MKSPIRFLNDSKGRVWWKGSLWPNLNPPRIKPFMQRNAKRRLPTSYRVRAPFQTEKTKCLFYGIQDELLDHLLCSQFEWHPTRVTRTGSERSRSGPNHRVGKPCCKVNGLRTHPRPPLTSSQQPLFPPTPVASLLAAEHGSIPALSDTSFGPPPPCSAAACRVSRPG